MTRNRLPLRLCETSAKTRALKTELAACARGQVALKQRIYHAAASSLEHDRWDFFAMGGGTLICMSIVFLAMTLLMLRQGMSGWAMTGVFSVGFLVWGLVDERLWRIARDTERQAAWKKALHSPETLSLAQNPFPAEANALIEGLTVAEASALLVAQERCLRDAIEIERAAFFGARRGDQRREGSASPFEATSADGLQRSRDAATDSLSGLSARPTRKATRL